MGAQQSHATAGRAPRRATHDAIRHWRKDSRDDIRRAGRVAGRDRREDTLRKARRALLEK